MRKEDVLIIKIEDISSEGLGVGHVGADGGARAGAGAEAGVEAAYATDVAADIDSVDAADAVATAGTAGFTLFVKDTVIGDVAEVKIVKMKKNYGYARLLRLLTASYDRIEAPCPQARRCGGCQIQEMSYEAQLEFKERKVRSNLQRIGGFTEIPMEPILGMEQPFRYRNKAQYPIGRARDGHPIAGFYAGRTHTVIDCRDCLLGAEVNQVILDIILNHMETCGIAPYDEATGKGLVRHVMIRVGRRALSYRYNSQMPGTRNGEAGAQAGAEYEAGAIVAENPEKTKRTQCADAKVCKAGIKGAQRAEKLKSAEVDMCGASVKSAEVDMCGASAKSAEVDMCEASTKSADPGSDEIMVCIVINGTSLPQSDRLIKALRGISGMTSITLNINRERTNVIMGQQQKLLWGKEYIEDMLGGVRFRISPLSFYQVNPRQAEKLYEKALEYANLTGNETVWDLYCGIGTISLFLARRARAVYGVEIVPDAIRDARQNAQLNGITNAEFIVGKAEEILPQKYQNEGIHADVIVVDPPRKGCEQSVLDTMLKIRPSRIVYVSCDPATLARDLHYLHEGGYELKKVCPVDMFGNSVHCESVALVMRTEG